MINFISTLCTIIVTIMAASVIVAVYTIALVVSEVICAKK